MKSVLVQYENYPHVMWNLKTAGTLRLKTKDSIIDSGAEDILHVDLLKLLLFKQQYSIRHEMSQGNHARLHFGELRIYL